VVGDASSGFPKVQFQSFASQRRKFYQEQGKIKHKRKSFHFPLPLDKFGILNSLPVQRVHFEQPLDAEIKRCCLYCF